MNNSKIKQYNRALKQGANTRHVFKRDDKWVVKRAAASRAAIVTGTQQEAIKEARRMVNGSKARIVIHGRDGRIRGVE